jgi:glycosyltransferase involved in cell wall biosynthesis
LLPLMAREIPPRRRSPHAPAMDTTVRRRGNGTASMGLDKPATAGDRRRRSPFARSPPPALVAALAVAMAVGYMLRELTAPAGTDSALSLRGAPLPAAQGYRRLHPDPSRHSGHRPTSDELVASAAVAVEDEFQDPAWWLEDTMDDFYEREYMPRNVLTSARDINRKQFFTGMCGFYRFNTSVMPDVTVIVTVQNEQDGMLTLTIHSLLARTPPELLREIIIVDDNGFGPDVRGPVNETELEVLKALSPKISILANEKREGCARSRMVGARAATGEVLVFVDSHIEMESATWLEHLLLPIIENPRTMALQTLDIISDLDHSYGDGSGDLLYGIVTDQFWFGYQRSRFPEPETEKPGRRLPYETPFGPGSLFAIRRDEFWRLGGYDKGLYVWGGENTELALKMWTCGGRMMMVPCSRVGHMYRVHLKEVGRWPPHLPQELTDRLGCGHPGAFIAHGSHADNFTKIITRNNIRIMNTWIGDHQAKRGYYEKTFGTATLPPEWQQYEDEMANDPAAQEQHDIRDRNKCRSYAWFDRHVYKKIVGVHHPWHQSIKDHGKTWI